MHRSTCILLFAIVLALALNTAHAALSAEVNRNIPGGLQDSPASDLYVPSPRFIIRF